MLAYALLSFSSALLLFVVQPLMARRLLPWFGGSAAVWTTALVFYQTALFGGYLYAHVSRGMGTRRQASVHAALLATSVLFLPIVPPESCRLTGPEMPVPRLLGVLAITVGLPYLLLAATTPLLHDWFARREPARSPYVLYAVSNAGSLLALGLYPTLMEPWLGVGTQALVWSGAYLAFGVACAALAVAVARGGEGARAADTRPEQASPARQEAVPAARHRHEVMHWLALAACGSALLLAVTNQITMDVAAAPLFWVVPLAVYLATYVAAFAGAYRRPTWGALLALAVPAAALLWSGGFALPVGVQMAVGLGVLTAGCMACHGELARLAPEPERLTGFYLAMAGGGALGGLSVAIVAPAVLDDLYELPFAIVAAYGLLLVSMRRDPESVLARGWASPAGMVLIAAGVLGAGAFLGPVRARASGTVDVARGFYGVLRVQDGPPGLFNEMRVLRHGRIFHGAQHLDPARRDRPTAYFVAGSGVARAIAAGRERRGDAPLRLGVVGLGVGTLAAWGEPGDTVRFFEIDPVAIRMAREHFSFLAGTRAVAEVLAGDGRLRLERELRRADGEPMFDVLVIDAFSGDAVPVHLLTREALGLYLGALEPDGTLVFQITNRHVDLERVVRGLAADSGLAAIRIDQGAAPELGGAPSSWMLLSRDGAALPVTDPAASGEGDRESVLWTDERASLLPLLRWGGSRPPGGRP